MRATSLALPGIAVSTELTNYVESTHHTTLLSHFIIFSRSCTFFKHYQYIYIYSSLNVKVSFNNIQQRIQL